MIIYTSLLKMYPQDKLAERAHEWAPLDCSSLLYYVLAPEVALNLIQTDQASSRKEALVTLRKSCQYGAQMFPDDDDEGGDGSDDDD